MLGLLIVGIAVAVTAAVVYLALKLAGDDADENFSDERVACATQSCPLGEPLAGEEAQAGQDEGEEEEEEDVPEWKVTTYLRSKDAIHDDGGGFANYLPDFFPAGSPASSIEARFYVDITTADGGQQLGHRHLTAFVEKLEEGEDAEFKPESGKNVKWTLEKGSNLVRFRAVGGGALSNELTLATDGDGYAEVVITHPAQSVAQGDARVVIRAEIDAGPDKDGQDRVEFFETSLAITRNDSITDIDDIARKNNNDADHIWVCQTDNFSARNPGIVDLQELLNEVVSRHRGIANFDFLRLDGIFRLDAATAMNDTRLAIRRYLDNFTNVSGADYPYDLSNINISPNLTAYLRAEYDFDATTNDNRGKIVDRRLLVGTTWDITPANIDGLLELKEGVVDRLITSMENTANDYMNENTFWLHRAIHQPNQNVAAQVFRVWQNNTQVRSGPNAAAAPLMDAGGNPIVASDGDRFPSGGQQQGGFTQVVHPSAPGQPGWIRANRGFLYGDNQSNNRNHGVLGRVVDGIDYSNGVAYSFGCKDVVADYRTQLENNDHAPPTDNPNNNQPNKLRVAHWDEYQNQHRVGRTSQEPAWPAPLPGGGFGQVPPNGIQNHTGIDCSGFTQVCVTSAQFPDGTPIVPVALTRPCPVNQNRVPLNAIGANSWVGNNAHARRIAAPAASNETQWLRKGDVITSAGHIVWVADDLPNNNNRVVNQQRGTFHVFNAYGSDRFFLANGGQAPVDNQRFLRKTIRMPFYYWGVNIGGLNAGKLYIWR